MTRGISQDYRRGRKTGVPYMREQFNSYLLLNDVWFQYGENGVKIIPVGMDVQINGLGKIQAEDTHDGLCINDIAAGNEIEIKRETVDGIYKSFYFVDRIQRNADCFHVYFLHSCNCEISNIQFQNKRQRNG